MLQPSLADKIDDLALEILMAFFLMPYYNLIYTQEEGRSNGRIKTHSGG